MCSFKFFAHVHYDVCSLELRELEGKLKAGYMNKVRAAQLAEKDALRTKEDVCCTCTSVDYMYLCVCVCVFVWGGGSTTICVTLGLYYA